MNQRCAHMGIRIKKTSLRFSRFQTHAKVLHKKQLQVFKESASLTPYPVTKDFILAFQVSSRSSLSGFSLQSLERRRHPEPARLECLVRLALPASGSSCFCLLITGRAQKDKLKFYVWFLAGYITRCDMQTGTVTLPYMIYSMPRRKTAIYP